MRGVEKLDRRACRRWVEDRFTVDHMVENYVTVYERLLGIEPMLTQRFRKAFGETPP